MTAPIASDRSESPGGPCTHWKAPPFHGARRKRPFAFQKRCVRAGPEFGVSLAQQQEDQTMRKLRLLVSMALFLFALPAFAAEYPAPKDGEWVARDFKFHT